MPLKILGNEGIAFDHIKDRSQSVEVQISQEEKINIRRWLRRSFRGNDITIWDVLFKFLKYRRYHKIENEHAAKITIGRLLNSAGFYKTSRMKMRAFEMYAVYSRPGKFDHLL